MAKFVVVLRSVHFVNTDNITEGQRLDLRAAYEPTPEEPEPDEEWYAEEWAMEQVNPTASEVEVLDCHPVRSNSITDFYPEV